MQANPLLHHVLDDDALTRHLGDAEARILVEWLVEQAERLAQSHAGNADQEVRRLCRRARAISRFVSLWSLQRLRGAAGQLAVAERFYWPLPEGDLDPCELMQEILFWESQELDQSSSCLSSPNHQK
jgi:hypothetical protein